MKIVYPATTISALCQTVSTLFLFPRWSFSDSGGRKTIENWSIIFQWIAPLSGNFHGSLILRVTWQNEWKLDVRPPQGHGFLWRRAASNWSLVICVARSSHPFVSFQSEADLCARFYHNCWCLMAHESDSAIFLLDCRDCCLRPTIYPSTLKMLLANPALQYQALKVPCSYFYRRCHSNMALFSITQNKILTKQDWIPDILQNIFFCALEMKESYIDFEWQNVCQM